MARIAIHLVTWNGEKFIPHCLKSVAEQSFRDFELVVVDNGSRDGTVAEIEKWDRTKINLTQIQRNSQNHGFAGGHNEAMALTGAAYVLMLNQDIILAPDFLAHIVQFLDSRPGVGAVGGKLLRWKLENEEKLHVIDTVGLRIFKSHRVVELGQGEQDRGQYEKSMAVFGVSGACPVYRRAALEDVALNTSKITKGDEMRSSGVSTERSVHGSTVSEERNEEQARQGFPSKGTGFARPVAGGTDRALREFFDQDFFSYKEDVDLAYRLQWRGWKSWYYPRAIAWHARSVGGSEDLSDQASRRGRKGKRTIVTRWSYRNHLGFLVKNVSRKTFMRYGYAIGWYELKKFLWIIFTEWRTLPALWQFFRLVPRFIDKRRQIRQNRKVQDIQIWRQMSV